MVFGYCIALQNPLFLLFLYFEYESSYLLSNEIIHEYIQMQRIEK